MPSDPEESAIERVQKDATPSTWDKIGLLLTAMVMIPFGCALAIIAKIFRRNKDG